MSPITRVFDLLDELPNRYSGNNPILYSDAENRGFSCNVSNYISSCYSLANALLDMGFHKGDHVALIVNNRPEWNFCDMALAMTGMIQVPVYATMSTQQIKYIFNDAHIKGLIINGQEIHEKINEIIPEVSSLKKILSIDPVPGYVNVSDLIEQYALASPEKVRRISSTISPHDLFAIIYTSGTTGNPKGVMLTHGNIVSNFLSLTQILAQQPVSKAVSVLPLCHIYERILNYTYQNSGTAIWYIDGVANLKEGLLNARPQMFCAVPRLLEKLYDAILAKGRELKGVKKWLFFRALSVAQKYEPDKKQSLIYRVQIAFYRKLVFSKWKLAVGGELISIVSGGAALNPRIARAFWAAGFKLMEGYGLTETSPVIAVSNFLPSGAKIGTVGPILPGVDVKFATDGEILVRGPNVMKGYYNDPDYTAQCFDEDGWYKTGDVGQMIDNKYLKITDRKKEMFKTSGGKYIAPQVLENRFKDSAFIEQIMVVGENRKHPSAIIVPAFEYLRKWCELKGIAYTSDIEMIGNELVNARLAREINKINQDFGHHEQIKKWVLVSDSWTADTGELSQTLKLRRRYLYEKYTDLISTMYE